jgi:DNA-binding NtrC family response regulator
VKHDTILYISDHAISSDSVIVELEEMGYEVVSTESSTQGIALLYIMHSVAAVVLHHRAEDRTWSKLAQSLRAIRPGVPIVLLSRNQIDRLPPCVDACVTTEQPPEKLTSEVRSLLTEERFEVHSAQC